MKTIASKSTKFIKSFNMKSLLHNKYVLYLIVLASVLNILLLANGKDFNSVVIFIIVGFLTSFFSKNMIVILLIALLFTHGIKYGNKVIRKEGLRYCRGMNYGLLKLYIEHKWTNYDAFFLLTNDTELFPVETIKTMRELLQNHPRVGILSPCSSKWGENLLLKDI